MLRDVFSVEVYDLLPSFSQLSDPILPELLRPGVDPLVDMPLKVCLAPCVPSSQEVLQAKEEVVVAWRDVR